MRRSQWLAVSLSAVSASFACGGCDSASVTSNNDASITADADGSQHDAGVTNCLHGDASVCGVCGAPCDAVSALATAQHAIQLLAVGATNIYWTTDVGASMNVGTLMKMPIAGGTPTMLATGVGQVAALAIDATHAYWTTYSATAAVMKVDLGGGTPVTLASDQAGPRAIAVDATHVYWATEGADVLSGTLMKVPLAGGTPIELIAGPTIRPTAIAVDATSVYWTNFIPGAPGPTSAVMKVPLAGGQATRLVSGSMQLTGIAVDATNLYWVNHRVMKLPFAGGDAIEIATNAGQLQPAIALDATHIYRASYHDSVRRVPIEGGMPVTLSPGGAPVGVALRNAAVYWTDTAECDDGCPNGSLMRWMRGICDDGACR